MALFSMVATASLAMAECACASLILASVDDVPSLVCVAHKYLNGSTSSTAFSFIYMLVDGVGLMLLTMILLLLLASVVRAQGT